jgi:hypothetical protein
MQDLPLVKTFAYRCTMQPRAWGTTFYRHAPKVIPLKKFILLLMIKARSRYTWNGRMGSSDAEGTSRKINPGTCRECGITKDMSNKTWHYSHNVYELFVFFYRLSWTKIKLSSSRMWTTNWQGYKCGGARVLLVLMILKSTSLMVRWCEGGVNQGLLLNWTNRRRRKS